MSTRDAELRNRLVAELRASGSLHDARIAAAFRAVPRHAFIPDLALEDVYADSAIAIKFEGSVAVSSSSQPAMMAMMLEQLAPAEGERILEIGTGSGYNAALLATLAGPHGFVATLDIDDELVADARRSLDAAGFEQVRTLCANGVDGDPLDAPFDALIVTVAFETIPAAWFAQVRDGGRLVVPLSMRGIQKVVGFAYRAGRFASTSIVDGAFITVRGAGALVSEEFPAAERVLAGPFTETPPPISLGAWEAWSAFALWLALHDDAFCRVSGVFGLCVGSDACLIAPRDGAVALRHYGADAQVAARLRTALLAWSAAGRPGNAALRIEATRERGLSLFWR